MPVHDVNFVYSHLKHGGKRDAVRADYEKKLTEPDFYSAKFIQRHVEKNISELTARKSESREKFKYRDVHFYSYSEFVARWYNKVLLHYSDAHPTEFVFNKLAQEILGDWVSRMICSRPLLARRGSFLFTSRLTQLWD